MEFLVRGDTSPIKIGDDLGYIVDLIRHEGRPGSVGEFWLHGEGGHAGSLERAMGSGEDVCNFGRFHRGGVRPMGKSLAFLTPVFNEIPVIDG